METEKKSIEEILKALIDSSFLSNAGKGARVCYPNEFLSRLYGAQILDHYWISEKNELLKRVV